MERLVFFSIVAHCPYYNFTVKDSFGSKNFIMGPIIHILYYIMMVKNRSLLGILVLLCQDKFFIEHFKIHEPENRVVQMCYQIQAY